MSGAEYSKSENHTAAGISIRFPRVTRIRDDKDWQGATDLSHLEDLAKTSLTRTSASMKRLTKKRKAASATADDDDNEDGSGGGASGGGASSAAGGGAARGSSSSAVAASAAASASSPFSFSKTVRRPAKQSRPARADPDATESETETDCDGELPPLFQAAEVWHTSDSDATEEEDDELLFPQAAAAAMGRFSPNGSPRPVST